MFKRINYIIRLFINCIHKLNNDIQTLQTDTNEEFLAK